MIAVNVLSVAPIFALDIPFGISQPGIVIEQGQAVVTMPDGLRVSASRVVIGLRAGANLDDARLADLVSKIRGAVRPAYAEAFGDPVLAERCGLTRQFAIEFPPGVSITALINRLRALDDVIEWADADVLVSLHTLATPNDPLFGVQWSLLNTGLRIETSQGTAGADIRAAQAWAVLPELRPVVVAVIDTGVSQSHPEFQGLLIPGRNMTSGDSSAHDDDPIFSHGTFVSGILAARANNLLGIAGVAPNVLIMPVKVATSNAGFHTWTTNGLIWATDSGAQIANMSLSFQSGTVSQLNGLQNAMNYARDRGVLMISSTGNSPGSEIGFPAKWNSVIAVGGTNNRDEGFFGGTTGLEMDISAPADLIMTCVDTTVAPNTFAFQSGTSMSAPIVSGVAAMVWGAAPQLAASEVRDILVNSADDLGVPGVDAIFGAGRVNAYRAILMARDTLWCSVDVDFSGGGTAQDIFAFLQLYFTNDLRADFDRNGVLSVNDVFLFLESWFGTCQG